MHIFISPRVGGTTITMAEASILSCLLAGLSKIQPKMTPPLVVLRFINFQRFSPRQHQPLPGPTSRRLDLWCPEHSTMPELRTPCLVSGTLFEIILETTKTCLLVFIQTYFNLFQGLRQSLKHQTTMSPPPPSQTFLPLPTLWKR